MYVTADRVLDAALTAADAEDGHELYVIGAISDPYLVDDTAVSAYVLAEVPSPHYLAHHGLGRPHRCAAMGYDLGRVIRSEGDDIASGLAGYVVMMMIVLQHTTRLL